MLLNKGIDSSYDWYQLGCLLYGTIHPNDQNVELIEGHLPFTGSTTTTTLQAILVGKIEYKYASKEAQKLITALLNPDSKKRLGSHPSDFENHPVYHIPLLSNSGLLE